jgi:UDP-N-acetylmuramoyl-tripeptide--D-alanyl-D-alanine ligase
LSGAFWTHEEVCQALGLSAESAGPTYSRISTDTRSIGEGDLFVALRGERFDAHQFLAQAAAAGVMGAVVSYVPPNLPAGMRLYEVDDTLVALGSLARHRRARLGARFVAVVGSNGKTTTKELIRAVAATRFRTHATQGNLNNRVGVPLTLLSIAEETEVAVIEMGTNRPGEVAILTEIVRPDMAVVTSIGEEHLELLGDLDGVLREEVSVLEGVPPGGLGFVAEEPSELPDRAREILGVERVRVAGLDPSAELRPDDPEAIEIMEDGSTRWDWRGESVLLPIPGRFNVRNALLAFGVGEALGITPADAVRGVAQVAVPKLRGEWGHHGGLRVLADCYNSNPPSLRAAVDLVAALPARGRRIVVLGTMREMGEASERVHASSAEEIAARVGSGVEMVVATGAFVPAFAQHAPALGDKLIAREDPLEAYEALRPSLAGTETILLKASRGDELERWLPLLQRDFAERQP